MHVKFFVYLEERNPVDIVFGKSNLCLPGLAASLDSIVFDGPLILEYEGTSARIQCRPSAGVSRR